MSYVQPKMEEHGWVDHRRSLRLLQQRVKARNGWIRDNRPPNVTVHVPDGKFSVPVCIDLKTDVLKSAWCTAMDADSRIGYAYEMRYKGVFWPRQAPCEHAGVQSGDVLELVSTSSPEWLAFKQRPGREYYHARYFNHNDPQAYLKWATRACGGVNSSCAGGRD